MAHVEEVSERSTRRVEDCDGNKRTTTEMDGMVLGVVKRQ